MAVSFASDIRPLFRDGDIECMKSAGVLLDDAAWMSVPANAAHVLRAVSSGKMPRTDRGRAIEFLCSSNGWTPAIQPSERYSISSSGLTAGPLGMRLDPAMGGQVHQDTGSPSQHQATATVGLAWWYGGKPGAW
jgi:hypothetical protein